ncbi:MAG: hypothetical protein Q9222_005179 [Ikaeria aurantiellina]
MTITGKENRILAHLNTFLGQAQTGLRKEGIRKLSRNAHLKGLLIRICQETPDALEDLLFGLSNALEEYKKARAGERIEKKEAQKQRKRVLETEASGVDDNQREKRRKSAEHGSKQSSTSSSRDATTKSPTSSSVLSKDADNSSADGTITLVSTPSSTSDTGIGVTDDAPFPGPMSRVSSPLPQPGEAVRSRDCLSCTPKSHYASEASRNTPPARLHSNTPFSGRTSGAANVVMPSDNTKNDLITSVQASSPASDMPSEQADVSEPLPGSPIKSTCPRTDILSSCSIAGSISQQSDDSHTRQDITTSVEESNTLDSTSPEVEQRNGERTVPDGQSEDLQDAGSISSSVFDEFDLLISEDPEFAIYTQDEDMKLQLRDEFIEQVLPDHPRARQERSKSEQSANEVIELCAKLNFDYIKEQLLEFAEHKRLKPSERALIADLPKTAGFDIIFRALLVVHCNDSDTKLQRVYGLLRFIRSIDKRISEGNAPVLFTKGGDLRAKFRPAQLPGFFLEEMAEEVCRGLSRVKKIRKKEKFTRERHTAKHWENIIHDCGGVGVVFVFVFADISCDTVGHVFNDFQRACLARVISKMPAIQRLIKVFDDSALEEFCLQGQFNDELIAKIEGCVGPSSDDEDIIIPDDSDDSSSEGNCRGP